MSNSTDRDRQVRGLTLEDGAQIWRARDAYRARICWSMLCVLLFGMPVLAALLTHRWWLAVECAGIGRLVYWGVPRLLRLAISGTVTGTRWAGRWSLRTVQRWWKGLVMVLALGVLLTGCADAGFWWARTQGFYVDGNTACPAVQVHDGHCPAGVHQEVQR